MSENLKAFIIVFKTTKVHSNGGRPELSITINECNNHILSNKTPNIEVLPGV